MDALSESFLSNGDPIFTTSFSRFALCFSALSPHPNTGMLKHRSRGPRSSIQRAHLIFIFLIFIFLIFNFLIFNCMSALLYGVVALARLPSHSPFQMLQSTSVRWSVCLSVDPYYIMDSVTASLIEIFWSIAVFPVLIQGLTFL